MLFQILLILHIVAGSISLLSGTLIMILKKGDATHRKVGILFYYGMVVNGLAALALSIIHPNVMLFNIGIFSLYLVLSGKRVLNFRSATQPIKAGVYDYGIAAGMAIFGVISVGQGVYHLLTGNMGGIVILVFGTIGLLLLRQDIRFYTSATRNPTDWLKIHLTKMTGSYIAATTAFLVVNNTILPGIVAWLLPTVIGSALISRWQQRLQKQ